MKSKIRASVELAVAVVLIVFGCVLLMLGFWVNPTGIIDNSVLIAFGQILVFTGAIFGIDYHKLKVLEGVKRSKDV